MNIIQHYGQIASGRCTTGIVPAFQFSVLTCHRRVLATKIVYADEKERPYDDARTFQFKYCELVLEDFAKALVWLANEPRRFIIRGQLQPGLSGWQRRLIKPRDNDDATIECPPRRWIVLDVDGVRVPVGLGASDKLVEAGYHIRDHILPGYFRGVQCVASASASTGREGLCTARLRLFFALPEPADNEALRLWATALSEKHTFIDPSVMIPNQPIYTARPIFDGCKDPVPEWGRVRLLEGYEEVLAIDLPKARPKKQSEATRAPEIRVCNDMPDWMTELATQDAGCGVTVIDISDKAWPALRSIFNMLDGSPKGGVGRHVALNTGAWWLARLWAEGELPEDKAREAYWKAAEGINNSDGKYDTGLLARHIDDAFADVCRG
jgi:hypothetical protein